MADEKDTKLATALRQAKQQPMNFAFIAKGTTEGVLIVSKKKIPVKDINEAKQESGGKKVLRGRCSGEGGRMVFELAKEPPSVLAKQLKAVIHESAGMMLQIETRMAPDLAEEEEENEVETQDEVPEAPPVNPSAPVAPPVAPPTAPQSNDAGRFSTRLKALAPLLQRIAALTSQPAKDAKLALSEANARFRANQWDEANEKLDELERLIKEALKAGAGQGGSESQDGQDAGARFATRLKALAPVLAKAEATGSDFARQAKVKIGDANKLYVAKQFNDANAALDQVEALIKQAFAGLASGNGPAYTAALTSYQSSRQQAIGRLRDLAAEIGAETHPNAAKAQIEVRGVIAQLSEAPATMKQVLDLQKYLLQDDVVFDVCDLAYDFRTPLLNALNQLKAALPK